MQNVLSLPWKREHDRLASSDPVTDAAVVEPEPALGTRDDGATRDVPAVVTSIDDTVDVTAAAVETQTVNVQRIELFSLASLVARCALIVIGLGVLVCTILWIVAAGTGVVGSTESYMRSVGFRGFHLSGVKIIAGATLVITGFVLATAALVVVAGGVYNVLAARGGGLRFHLALAGDALATSDAATVAEPEATQLVVAPVAASERSDEGDTADRDDAFPSGDAA